MQASETVAVSREVPWGCDWGIGATPTNDTEEVTARLPQLQGRQRMQLPGMSGPSHEQTCQRQAWPQLLLKSPGGQTKRASPPMGMWLLQGQPTLSLPPAKGTAGSGATACRAGGRPVPGSLPAGRRGRGAGCPQNAPDTCPWRQLHAREASCSPRWPVASGCSMGWSTRMLQSQETGRGGKQRPGLAP